MSPRPTERLRDPRRRVDDALRKRLRRRLGAGPPVDVVVCTRSTLGEALSLLPPCLLFSRPGRWPKLPSPVDRASPWPRRWRELARLLEQSTAVAGTTAVVEDASRLDAWSLVEAGDHDAYLDRVAEQVWATPCSATAEYSQVPLPPHELLVSRDLQRCAVIALSCTRT